MKTEVQLGDVRLDGVWEGPEGPVLIEVKRTHSARDLRDGLLQLVYGLRQTPFATRAVCIVVDSRLTEDRVTNELEAFRDMIRPELAGRLHALVVRDRRLTGSFEPSDALASAIIELAMKEASAGRARRSSAALPAKHAVVATLVAQQLIGGGNPQSLRTTQLQEIGGVSYPTVAAALQDLRMAGLLDDTKSGIRLLPLAASQLQEFAVEHAKQRKSRYFVDPTGMSSPLELMKRFEKRRAHDTLPKTVRVGGVLGATYHYPPLDITAPLRLDLVAHGDVDALEVARTLDAGLTERTDPRQQPVLAIHSTFDPLIHRDLASHVPYASALECLADLIDMGYQREAREFAQHVLEEART